MIKTLTANFNGITMAYAMGLVNSLLAVLLAFGVTLSDQQTAAIVGFTNAALVILAHVGHRLGEALSTQHPTPVATPAPAAAPAPTVEPAPTPVAPVLATVPDPPVVTQ